MRTLSLATVIALLFSTAAFSASAADNQLTPQEKAAGWQLLFNGKDYDGWICNNGKKPKMTIEDGCLVPAKSGGYLLVYGKKQFGDFILKCDVKMPKRCNSGIFFRIGNLRDPVQTGLEMQVASGKGAGYHDFGAIYDLAKPTKNMNKGPNKWNTVTITCKGPIITVNINGETVTRMNCDEFTQPHKRPDGSRHKFRKAIKDFPRKGYIGFQDHFDGTKCWFKNIKILELKN